MNIARDEQGRVRVEAEAYQLCLDTNEGFAQLLNAGGKEYFRFPLDVEIFLPDGSSTGMPQPISSQVNGGTVELSAGGNSSWSEQRLIIRPYEKYFTVEYRARAAGDISVYECRLFSRENHGMLLRNMIKGFNPVPLHSRNALEDLYNLMPRIDTAHSYYTPAPLNIGLCMTNGWVGIGMVDLPGGTEFGLTETWGLTVDEPAGHLPTRTDEEYTSPRIVFTFPKDEWQGMALYRTALVEMGVVESVPIEERGYPDWWKRPMYCTYGDQIQEHQPYWLTDWYWGVHHFTSDWVRGAVAELEGRLGYKDFTVIIDAFWMNPWDADPKPSSRFPDMRELIDWLHGRGHKVLLWYFPFETSLKGGSGSDARRFGVLAPDTEDGAEKAAIDATSPGFPDYARYVAGQLFGPDGLDADGLKLDFLAHLRNPKDARYRNPEAGTGLKEALLWLRTFGDAARSVKPDVHLNWSAADPHFEGLFASNRTHDTHLSMEEFERRVRISTLAAPNATVNFDGCLMHPEWFYPCYLEAALYGTPSLYYSREFHGGEPVSDEHLSVLGRLFDICSRRPWGRVKFVSSGRWQLESGGRIVGETAESRAIILFTDDCTAEVFSVADGETRLPLHGRPVAGITPVPENLAIQDGSITARWKKGVPYRLDLEG